MKEWEFEGVEETLAAMFKECQDGKREEDGKRPSSKKKMETPSVQGVPWRRWRAMGASHFWGDSSWAQEANYSKRVQSATAKTSPRSCWIPLCQSLNIQLDKGLSQRCLDKAFAKKHWSRWCSKPGVPWLWGYQKEWAKQINHEREVRRILQSLALFFTRWRLTEQRVY